MEVILKVKVEALTERERQRAGIIVSQAEGTEEESKGRGGGRCPILKFQS